MTMFSVLSPREETKESNFQSSSGTTHYPGATWKQQPAALYPSVSRGTKYIP